MFAPEAVDPIVDRLVELAGEGRALELGIGTGRIASWGGGKREPFTGHSRKHVSVRKA